MGLIDVELLNLLIKLDEWFEKKRILQVSETMRGDVLSLLCNKTVSCNTSLNKESSIPACAWGNFDNADNVQCQSTKSMNTTLRTESGSCVDRSGISEYNINKQVYFKNNASKLCIIILKHRTFQLLLL